mgnify:CR=1 FL=1
MRRASQFFLPAIVAMLTVLAVPNGVQAGEPLHPIIQPILDFARYFFWF